MDHREKVTEVAKSLGLLDGDGQLIRLDSLMVVDLVVALEESIGTPIPVSALAEETFLSIDSVTEMLATVTSAGSAG